MKRVGAAVAALTMALTVAGCSGGGSSDDISIGLLAPLTGGSAATAEAQQKAVQLAVDEFNDAGGVDGEDVKLKVYDTKLEPETAAQQAQRAITQDKVAAMIGPFSTSEALAVGTIVDRSKVATITGSVSTESITTDSDYLFRTAPRAGDLSSGLVQTAQQVGVKSAVVMYDSGGFGTGIHERLEGIAKDAGLTITQSLQYPLSASDVSAEVTKARSGAPGAVIVAGSNAADYGLIIKTLAEQGLRVPVFGYSPIVLPDAISIAAGSYDKMRGVYTVEGADATKPEYQALLAAYSKKYGAVDALPEQVLGSYDAVQFILEALKQTKGKGGDDLATALEKLPARVGANGRTGAEEQFGAGKHDAFDGANVSPYKVVKGQPTQDTNLKLE